MPTRVVTGKLIRHDHSPLAGAKVVFRLVDDAYTVSPAETFPIHPLTKITGTDGTFTATLAAGLGVKYEVELPDESTFEIWVPEGSATTLEEAIRLMSRHQVGKELGGPQIKAIEAFLATLTGDPPKELTVKPK